MNNRVAGISLFLLISIMFFFALRNSGFYQSRNEPYLTYRIQFEYFGMDTAILERLITIPLEEKVGSLPSLVRTVSTVSWGKSVTTLYFERIVTHIQVYTELRTIVDALYERLPPAVQKPEIYSSASSVPNLLVFSISSKKKSLTQIRQLVEQEVKSKIESIPGVAEAVIAGGSIPEILVCFNNDATSIRSINTVAIAQSIAQGHILTPGGFFRTPEKIIPLRIETRIPKIVDFLQLPVNINKSRIKLSSIATITTTERTPEEITRVNGEDCIILSVRPSSNANTYRVSIECKEVVKNVLDKSMEVVVLHDEGAVFIEVLLRLALSLGITFVLTLLVVPFFFNSKKIILTVLWYLPACIFWSLGVLALIRVPIDQNCIAGIVISVGLVIDPILVVNEKKDSVAVNKKVYVGIAVSTLTSAIVLLPLIFMDYLVPGIRAVSFSIMSMLIVSYLLTLFYGHKISKDTRRSDPLIPRKLFITVQRLSYRIIFRLSNLFIYRKYYAVFLVVLFCLGTIILFQFSKKNMSFIESQSYINFKIEYENERSSLYIEENSKSILQKIYSLPGIYSVQSESRKGSLEGYVSYDSSVIRKGDLVQQIHAFASLVPDGFLYLPDLGKKDSGIQTLEIAVCGRETSVCCEFVQKTVSTISQSKSIAQAVINFKRPDRILVFYPDREKLTLANLTVRDTAEALRWVLFGSVIEKWFEGTEERDIRLRGFKDVPIERSFLENISFPGLNSPQMLESIGSFRDVNVPGRIQRKNGNRAAWFTAHVRADSLGEAASIVNLMLEKTALPSGYYYSFPEELDAMNDSMRILFVVFCFTIVALVIVLIALTENFLNGILVALSIPVSVFIPLALRFVFSIPIQTGDLLGMVIVSGVCVNNVIYVVGQKSCGIRNCLRKRMSSLFATTLTTVAGAGPMAFLGKGDFTSSLAFFMLWGTAASLIYTLMLFPAFAVRSTRSNEC